jgi:hypothetical protein
MFITVDNQEYAVNFEYDHREDKTVQNTHCTVVRVDARTGEKSFDGTVIGFGSASCNPMDNFVKAVGREIALDRALEKTGMTKEQMRQLKQQLFMVIRHSSRNQHPV